MLNMEKELTHFNDQGRAHMVDVGQKACTVRRAVAQATVRVHPKTFGLIVSGGMKKGDVLAVAQVAGIMAAKQTASIIPMCHPVPLTSLDISFSLDEKASTIDILASAGCAGQTGVEMEALTAASVAALTVYDMCKAVQRDIVIERVVLLEKSGGKSGTYRWEDLHG